MNILGISKDFSGESLFWRLKKEGHSVRVFVEDKGQWVYMDNMLEKTEDWKKELPWVGKNGLIIFDSVGHGKLQNELRKQGYSVIGGSQEGDRLERDRQHGQKIMAVCGIKIAPSANFSNTGDAIKFLKKHSGPWVIKQNGHVDKSFNYVGQLENNEDCIEVLQNYFRHNRGECASIDLQKRIDGVEIGVGRYFNGTDWVGPLEINIEHKNLMNGDLGPKTFEMGTLMWYDDNEKNKLFQETLAKLKDYLAHVDFRGDVEVNCIVNQTGAYPLELCARFGYPAWQLQTEFHQSPWGEFFKAVADGQPYKLKFRKGYGVVVLVATPPFPYEVRSKKYYPKGIDILFKPGFNEKDMQHIHFEEVSLRRRGKTQKYYVSSKTGYVLHVSGFGKTVEEARKMAYGIIDKIIIPKMFYRTDIGGMKFVKQDRPKLKKWGYL